LHDSGAKLNTVGGISQALTPFLGNVGSEVQALVAVIVSSLAGADPDAGSVDLVGLPAGV